MASGDTKTNQYLDIAANGARADLPTDTCCETRSQTLIRGVAERIMDLEDEVHEWENNPDVADIVDTYADLQDYDTSTLADKDIIRVLNDETHNDESTYYRYDKANDTWTYIGSTGPKGGVQSDWAENDSSVPAYIKNRTHYTETVTEEIPEATTVEVGTTPDPDYVWLAEQLVDYSLSDILDVEDGDTVYLTIKYSVAGVAKTDGAKFIVTVEQGEISLDAEAQAGNRWRGAYVMESSGNTTVRWPVSTSDTSSTVFVTEMDYEIVKELDAKYVPVDGDTIRVNAQGKIEADVTGGPTVVQTPGNSTTDVMSQNAVTSMVFADPGPNNTVKIGTSSYTPGNGAVSIGTQAGARSAYDVAIGRQSQTNGQYGVAIGNGATAGFGAGVGVGSGAKVNGGYGVAIGYQSTVSTLKSGGVALGAFSNVTETGEVNIGTTQTSYGYNNSNYRLLTGVYDPQNAHDAATKGYVDGLVGDVAAAINAINNGTGA